MSFTLSIVQWERNKNFSIWNRRNKANIKNCDKLSRLYLHNYSFPLWKTDELESGLKWQRQNVFTLPFIRIIQMKLHQNACIKCKCYELVKSVMKRKHERREKKKYEKEFAKWFVNRSNQTGPPMWVTSNFDDYHKIGYIKCQMCYC